ncbi:ABC transporter ATP-binding protein [Faecalicatena orotica]|uniref:ABC transporter ATP-binding protein n=1 Tax=Faecalicatena orotica TaxID=1544 RepID=UPI003216FCA1
MASQSVKIIDATKIYGDFKACDHISLDIKEGEFFTLLGPSGCGKTTLLRMIAGFNKIDEGHIYFSEKEINHIPADKRNIGMVFQNYAIFPHMTVMENVAYGLKARKVKGEELTNRAMEAMKMMQIDNLKDRMPSQLSGGQQQRVALARAIVIHPDVLLMDEPLCNLDAKLRVTMRTGIKKIQRQLNITTIYVTHDQEEALSISDRIAVIHDGKVEQLGKPKEIYTKPVNMFVANFIGTSCFLDGEAEKGEVEILGCKRIKLNIDPDFQGKVKVAVRPEYAALEDEKAGELTGTITLATFLGDYMSYEIELQDGTFIEINEYTDRLNNIRQTGDKISLGLLESRLNVFDAATEKSIMKY